jgi:hypothetical protein
MVSSKKLTEQEQEEAIAKLRTLLSDDIDAKLKQGGEEGLNEPCLRRWLVARKWDVELTAKCITTHAEWRANNTPQGRITEVGAVSSTLHVPQRGRTLRTMPQLCRSRC